MDVATTGAIERVARVLAARRLSTNAEGAQASAAHQVDAAWQDHREDAVAVLKTLREPDEAMAAAGDAMVWARMVAVALGDPVPTESHVSVAFEEPPEPGTDPFHEGP